MMKVMMWLNYQQGKASAGISPVLVNCSRTTTGHQHQLMLSIHSTVDNAVSPNDTANILGSKYKTAYSQVKGHF